MLGKDQGQGDILLGISGSTGGHLVTIDIYTPIMEAAQRKEGRNAYIVRGKPQVPDVLLPCDGRRPGPWWET